MYRAARVTGLLRTESQLLSRRALEISASGVSSANGVLVQVTGCVNIAGKYTEWGVCCGARCVAAAVQFVDAALAAEAVCTGI